MSYIPDYRKETDKLNEVDRAYIGGYRQAIEDIKCFFDNLDDDELYTIENEVIRKLKAEIEDWMEGEEVMTVCSLFDNADYLQEDVELVDASAEIWKQKAKSVSI